MSEETVHVQHEFVPKLLRRKVEVAIENRHAFVEERKRRMVPYLLANRNVAIARRALPWYKRGFFSWLFKTYDGPIMSAEQAARLPFDDYKAMRSATNFWERRDDVHPLDPVIYGPHNHAILDLMGEISSGSKWVDQINKLHNNLKRTPTRRVYVSEAVLSEITFWAAFQE